jgi:DNA anti-recombination protein RmuC
MPKETKKNKKTVLKKEHFEILLEDIQDKFKFIAEGHDVLNNKIDNLTNELHTSLKSTQDELVFLIKASIDKSEERLTKKIEEGDNAVLEHVDRRFDETNQKIDAINNNLKTHAESLAEHDERILRLESKG